MISIASCLSWPRDPSACIAHQMEDPVISPGEIFFVQQQQMQAQMQAQAAEQERLTAFLLLLADPASSVRDEDEA